MNFFGKNVKYLRETNGMKQAEIPNSIGFSRTAWNNYELGKSNPNLDDFIKIAKFFGISETDLLHLDLEKGQDYKIKNVRKKGQDYGQDKGQDSLILREPTVTFSPKVITVNSDGKDNILYVPVAARAGYLTGYGDHEYLSKLQAFSMPGLRNGMFRMFDISGPSMAPTVGDNDKVIGRYVESLSDIKDDAVYIVVTKSEGIVLKRVMNRVSERNKIVLKSDTIAHRLEFKTYEIDPSDVLEIWFAYIKISADFSPPAEIYHRINALETDMLEQQRITTHLMASFEDMKKRLK